jgi:VWFA-related protein
MRLSALGIAWVCLLTAGSSARQQLPQAQQPPFRSGVDVVQLDVSVLDKQRRPVPGLAAADFTVLENGTPRDIVAFQAFDIPDKVVSSTEWMRDIAPDVATNRLFVGRLVVVLIDDLAMGRDYWTTATASRVAQTILDELGPDDLTAVVYTGSNAKAQNFTADRSRILEALSDIKRVAPRFGAVSAPSCTSARGSTSVVVLDELLRVTAALQAEPERRKTILFVSPGLRLRPSDSLSNDCAESLYKDLLRDALRGNINIYAIDPGRLLAGWRMDIAPRRGPSLAPPVPMVGRLDGLDGLRRLAENTGGRAIINTKEDNPEADIPQILDENRSYYLVGFRTGRSSLDGMFRKLEVKVNRAGVEVRTRSGYFAGAPNTRKPSQNKRPPVSPLDESVTGLLPLTATPLRLSAAPFRISGKQEAVVAMVLGVRQPMADAAAAQPMLSVVAHAYDLEGKSQAVHRETFDLTRGGSGEVLYEALLRLKLPPGRYELRVGTETASRQRGSVYAYVDVPDFAKDDLSLSGVVLERSPALPVAPRDALADLISVVPTTAREFAPTDRVSAFIRVYQGRRRPLAAQVVTRIVNDRSETVFEQTTSVDAERFDRMNRSVDYRLELPLTRLVAGEYLLTIEALVDERRQRRDVRFALR